MKKEEEKMKNKIKARIIKYSFALCAFMAYDYVLINELILGSNASPLVAMIAAAIFCAGLDIAPTFAGVGLDMLLKMKKMQINEGKMKAIVFLTVGATITITAFVMLFIIRRDTIIASGGFAARYDGLYGDLILLISPYITSALAFAIGIHMAPSAVERQKQIVEMNTEEVKLAHNKAERAFNNIKNPLVELWVSLFPDDDMPKDFKQALNEIYRKTINKRSERYTILLQLLDEKEFIVPLERKLKEILINRNVVTDPAFVAGLETSQITGVKEIVDARDNLRREISRVYNQIIEAVSDEKGGVKHVRIA
jgi:hypothetical protein